jgi:hypothetical protein
MRDAIIVSAFVLGKPGAKLAQLIGKKERVRSSPRFNIIRFSQEETDRIEEVGRSFGSRLSRSNMYVASTMLAIKSVIDKRKQDPPYFWFTIPRDTRPKRASEYLLTNMLSFMFFKVSTTDMLSLKSTIDALDQQFKEQLRKRISQRYSSLLSAFRIMPLSIYEWMVDLSAKGKVASFGFSDLGNDPVPVKTFVGSKVVGSFNYPPVPCPPGISIVTFKEKGQLVFVWGYVQEGIDRKELMEMEKEFKKTMLSPTDHCG